MTAILRSTTRAVGEIRGWPRVRWYLAILGASLAFAALALGSGVVGPAQQAQFGGVAFWVFPVIGAGALLLGALIASYVRAPIGAGATFCDLRWPMFGLIGLALASGQSTAGALFADFMVGPPGSLADLGRLALGIAAIAELAWALGQRLTIERAAVARSHADGDAVGATVCTTCRPLFPDGIGGSRTRP
ncbi:hypothetical protein BH11ACT4_BH11ACT4_11070 [soil metagenome]